MVLFRMQQCLLLQLTRPIPLEMLWTAPPSSAGGSAHSRHFGGVVPGSDASELVGKGVESRKRLTSAVPCTAYNKSYSRLHVLAVGTNIHL